MGPESTPQTASVCPKSSMLRNAHALGRVAHAAKPDMVVLIDKAARRVSPARLNSP